MIRTKLLRKIVSALALIALIASIGACGSGTTTPAPTTGEPTTASTAATTAGTTTAAETTTAASAAETTAAATTTAGTTTTTDAAATTTAGTTTTTAVTTTTAASTSTSSEDTAAATATRDLTWFTADARTTIPVSELDRYIPYYDPPISLSTVHWCATEFTGIGFPEGDSMEFNMYTRKYERLMGIKITYDWISDPSSYDTKLNLSIAANDLPDFFMIQEFKAFNDLAKAGKLLDLKQYYDEWATPFIKGFADSAPECFDSVYMDGKLFAVPIMGYGIITHPDILWMRDDWRKQAGLEPPKTIDELASTARKFMEMNPGTYGISLNSDLGGGSSSFRGLANSFHAYPGHWYEDDSGQIVFGSVQPEMRTCLQTLQSWYGEGILNQEFVITDFSQDIVKGKVGIDFGAQWTGSYPLTDAIKENPDAEWMPYPLPSVDGQPVKAQCYWDIEKYIVVNKDCKNPQAVIQMMNLSKWPLWINPDGNMVGLYADEKQDNTIEWQDDPIFLSDPGIIYKIYKTVLNAIISNDLTEVNSNTDYRISYEGAMKWLRDKDPDSFGVANQYMPGGAFDIIATQYIDPGNYLLSAMHGSSPDIWSEKRAVLDKMQKEAFIKIIMGAPIEEFDKFVQDWYALGGEESLKAVREMYGK